jgi:DNA polymerase-3 subunit beta
MAISRQAISGSERIAANEVIVPRKSSQLARKLLVTSNEDVTLVFGNKEFRLQFKDGTVLLSKCLEGKFPDWQRVVPQSPNTAKVVTDKLRTALTMIRATIDNSEASKKDATRRACSFVFGKTGIAISHADVASSEVEADSADASNEQVSLSVDYIADATDAVSTGEAVCFGFEDGSKPVTVRPAEAHYPLVVVMPMKD